VFALRGIPFGWQLGRLTFKLCASQHCTLGHLTSAESGPLRVQLHGPAGTSTIVNVIIIVT
jgi:hypothetical protein